MAFSLVKLKMRTSRRIAIAARKPFRKMALSRIPKTKAEAMVLAKQAIVHGVAPRVPIERGRVRVFNFNRSGWCSAYSTRLAEILFGMEYKKVAAWKMAEENHSVLNLLEIKSNGKLEHRKTRLSEFEHVLKPGRILGVWYPDSRNNRIALAAGGRPYSHAILYFGKINGKHYVLHNVHGPRFEPLEKALSGFLSLGKGNVQEIIEPKQK